MNGKTVTYRLDNHISTLSVYGNCKVNFTFFRRRQRFVDLIILYYQITKI